MNSSVQMQAARRWPHRFFSLSILEENSNFSTQTEDTLVAYIPSIRSLVFLVSHLTTSPGPFPFRSRPDPISTLISVTLSWSTPPHPGLPDLHYPFPLLCTVWFRLRIKSRTSWPTYCHGKLLCSLYPYKTPTPLLIQNLYFLITNLFSHAPPFLHMFFSIHYLEFLDVEQSPRRTKSVTRTTLD